MKRSKKLFLVVLALVLMVSLVPTTAFAVPSPIIGTVTVTVTNATYDGAPADRQGQFMKEEVQLTAGMTVEDAINQACENAGIVVVYDVSGIFKSIGGLGSNPDALLSGWFCAINNWFADTGNAAIEAQDGDWISIEYTNENSWDAFGADVGSVYGDFTKTLKALNFDSGKLAPTFSPTTHEYTLTVPRGTEGIVVSPLATNRNFMVKTFVGQTQYKLVDTVPVSEGTEITITSGDPEWPSMNKPDSEPAETYTITIAYEEAVDNGGIDENGEPEVIATEDNSPETGDSGMLLPLAMVLSLIAAALAVIVKRRTN